MPRAFVVHPPLRDFYATSHRFSALGLEAVRRVFVRHGWDVRVRVFPADHPGRVIPLPEALEHLVPHIIQGETGPARFFSHYRRFGPDFPEAAAAIAGTEPDLVVVGCFAYAYADDALDLARAFRAAAPRVSIIVGGAGVTVFPEYFEREDLFDAVLPGDTEAVLPEWLDRKYPGISRPVAAGVPAPDAAPAPLWTQRRRRVTTILSRGCPKGCRFCSQFLTQGRKLRTATMKAIDKMIAAWPADIEEVNIEDDNLLLAPDFFFAVLDRIRARFPDVVFFAENGIDYTLIDSESLKRLSTAGFQEFNLSVGSIHPEILHAQTRPGNLTRWEGLVTEIAGRGGSSTTYFICGLADDSPGRTAATLAYLAGFPTRPGISLFYPVPGLPGFTDMALFRDRPAVLAAGSSAWPWTGSLTTAQMITAFRLNRLVALRYALVQTAGAAATGQDGDPNPLLARCLETQMLWAEVRDHGKTKLVRVPHQDEEMSRAVLGTLCGHSKS